MFITGRQTLLETGGTRANGWGTHETGANAGVLTVYHWETGINGDGSETSQWLGYT